MKSRGGNADDDSNYTNMMAEHLINEHNDEDAARMINQGIVTASYIHDSSYPECEFGR
jgi:hypothetical protein